jgi:hypothetical protein
MLSSSQTAQQTQSTSRYLCATKAIRSVTLAGIHLSQKFTPSCKRCPPRPRSMLRYARNTSSPVLFAPPHSTTSPAAPSHAACASVCICGNRGSAIEARHAATRRVAHLVQRVQRTQRLRHRPVGADNGHTQRRKESVRIIIIIIIISSSSSSTPSHAKCE